MLLEKVHLSIYSEHTDVCTCSLRQISLPHGKLISKEKKKAKNFTSEILVFSFDFSFIVLVRCSL